MKRELSPDVQMALEAIGQREITHVFLVACGGSLSIMHPGKYFIDRHFETITSDLYNADEFICRHPRHLGEKALVILCSQTGTTRETANAARFARENGAVTVAMTLDLQSPLAEAADHVVRYDAPYTTGVPIDPADSNYAVLYMVLAGLLRQREGRDVVSSLLSSLGNLPSAIDQAKSVYEDRFETYADRFKDSSVIYTAASGAGYGAAYSFAICVLMEMQWINSQAIHANEFFHGPFEVVDENTNAILLIGMDETRRIEERTRDFLYRFGDRERIMVLDAAELDLSGIDAAFQGYLVPLVFFDALWGFAYKLAQRRNHTMLEARRYMKKIHDY